MMTVSPTAVRSVGEKRIGQEYRRHRIFNFARRITIGGWCHQFEHVRRRICPSASAGSADGTKSVATSVTLELTNAGNGSNKAGLRLLF